MGSKHFGLKNNSVYVYCLIYCNDFQEAKRSRTSTNRTELVVQANWKNFNVGSKKYEVVNKMKKHIPIPKKATTSLLTQTLVDAYFPEGSTKENTLKLTDVEYYVAKMDGTRMPENVDGKVCTYEEWIQDQPKPVRMYLYTKVTKIFKGFPDYFLEKSWDFRKVKECH